MASVPEEVLKELASMQASIWQAVSLTMSESSGQSVTLSSPLTLATTANELMAEMSKPKLIIQFAFATMPEHSQMVLVDADTFAGLASIFRGEDIQAADESLIAEVRPAFESIVQGICLAIGNALNEPMVATGLSLRFQILSLAPNLQRATELVRVNVALNCDDVTGTAVWLMDAETVHAIVGIPMSDEEGAPFSVPAPEAHALPPLAGSEVPKSLELLLDVPLEISVELGRVKMLVRDVVDLGSGSIVEIDKAAGEPVDVLVNGRLVARGEVVVIEDNFGVRLTEIMSPQDRLNRLNEVA